MIITVLDRVKGSTDAYGDPTITWTAYEIDATTCHPYREEPTQYRGPGTFRRAIYQLAFDTDARNIEYIKEMNRLILFNEQYQITLRVSWPDSLGTVIRIYVLAEKCVDTVIYS